jgi:hypothetical protein
MSRLNAVVAAFAVPWNAFVAAFVYYTLLTMIAIGVADVAAAFMAVAYLLPVTLYAAVLAGRAVRALAALPVEIAHTPQALLG